MYLRSITVHCSECKLHYLQVLPWCSDQSVKELLSLICVLASKINNKDQQVKCHYLFQTVCLKSARASCKIAICQFVERDRRLQPVIDQTLGFCNFLNILWHNGKYRLNV